MATFRGIVNIKSVHHAGVGWRLTTVLFTGVRPDWTRYIIRYKDNTDSFLDSRLRDLAGDTIECEGTLIDDRVIEIDNLKVQ